MNSSPKPWRPDVAQLAARLERPNGHPLARVLARLYHLRRLRGLVQRLCLRLESGQMFSATWRSILEETYSVRIGRYSYGDILKPGLLPSGTVVGAYCSVGAELIVRRRNHPMDRPILHPFFYNSRLGIVASDTIKGDHDNPLTIGHDVWIADRVTILPGCRNIGNGAVIAAGAVVTRDVAAYSIVAGNPARVLRMRFDPGRIAEIEASRWWELSITDLITNPPLSGIFGAVRGLPTVPTE